MTQDVLSAHFAAYPEMRPQDAVKLIYQHVFGPEHMIDNPEKTLNYLKREMAALSPRAGEALYESIGNGLCRLNLRPCLARGIPDIDINRLFVETARGMKGDDKQFRKALRELQDMAEAGDTPFDAVELDLFLARYPDSHPAVHHSEAYRAAYEPAYRVIAQKKVKDYLAARRESAGKP